MNSFWSWMPKSEKRCYSHKWKITPSMMHMPSPAFYRQCWRQGESVKDHYVILSTKHPCCNMIICSNGSESTCSKNSGVCLQTSQCLLLKHLILTQRNICYSYKGVWLLCLLLLHDKRSAYQDPIPKEPRFPSPLQGRSSLQNRLSQLLINLRFHLQKFYLCT